ncbi:DUF4376 domain-containing protein [Laribacter hongkongensis]|uniref:DUF4376 domain-containing protein n=1 Tax=Laribacter hongkongensis TaxID=168471 RepID=UPI001EFDE735|nr:DUF4376 domain-containing protein [Laribacter hongkongensis]MCG8990893.1 DUF4376 domain-containing protein [Laribacter hongkongensis]MCG8997039.1 DUF4376 domain-containing protein [Laribacter hongkongensis]MCG9001861.1 DUF4376 domain-containing protein [Laribacter hongkongensis]MCG9003530.1 DUF4376 domain-containing protein [Laribacter hongkongensis]MCG9008173.1 DUF4376 domain-containing protein [Laribacter hongkongensis]
MDLYNYTAQGLHVGTSTADESPLEPGVFLIPAHATPIAPPPAGQNEAAIFDGSSWRLVADYTGTSYWLPDGSHHVISEIGDVPPDHCLTESPPISLDTLRENALSQMPVWEKSERAAGIEHAGHRWLTTPLALQDIRDVLLAGAVTSEQWVTADRQIVPMTFTELQSLWQAITARGAAIYQRRLEMEQQLAGMSREQLEAFQPSWPSGSSTTA